ncbi:AI-2E family transporter [Bailinhaonella thermotolerans]|uniref:AI-2E family transporter n=1 Tax=Bailinhaonella thermotolerans TaxID=1070861 RepID=A0A3A4AGJ2_9ACTN|nr:AI-2E family transporter [Bailinhaonella thermotolerans]RJL24793.1 AI-2E family transporter [Bailinhaonella thermotolerans]
MAADTLRRMSETAARILVLIALTVVAVWALNTVRTVVVPVVLAVFVVALVLPLVDALRSRGVGRTLATTIVFLGGGAALTGLVLLLAPPTVRGVGELGDSIGKLGHDLQNLAARFGLGDRELAELIRRGREQLGKQGEHLATEAIAGARTAGEIVVGLVLTVILAIYFVHGGDRLVSWLRELVPDSTGRRIEHAGGIVLAVVGRYVRGVAIVGFVDAFFIGMALWILGVPIALPLAVLTFLGAFLPIVGAFTAGLLAAVVALVAKGWLVAVVVVAVTVLVQQLEGHILAPQIYGRALDLPAVVILLSIAVGTVWAGILGAFLAAPVAAVLVTLIREVRAPRHAPPPGATRAAPA